jgi:hypothetical protein
MPDDLRRNSKWQSLLSKETAALQHFCTSIQHAHQGITECAIHQESNCIEELYFMAQSSNVLFQDMFEFLASKSNVVPGSLLLCSDFFVSSLKSAKAQMNRGVCTLIRGPVKRPDRAISKVYRAYGGDVSRLTDLVRCSLRFDSFSDMESFTNAFLALCSFQNSQAHVASWPRHPYSSMSLPLFETREVDCADHSNNRLFRIERIRNRFDSSYQSPSAYRDFSIKVTIGIQASTQGRHALVPVREWHEPIACDGSRRRNKAVNLFTCEVQMHHRGIQLDDENGTVHDNYVAMRNLMSS